MANALGGPPGKDYFVGFNYAFDRQSVANFVGLVQQLVSQGANSITICMTSAGGPPDQALYIYDILSALPVDIITHATGAVQSSAVTMFLAGSERYATSGSSFLLHKTVFNVGVAGTSMTEQDLIGQAGAVEHNDRKFAERMAEETGKSAAEVTTWMEGQITRDTDFALANGIIHEVKPLVIPPGAEFIQSVYKF